MIANRPDWSPSDQVLRHFMSTRFLIKQLGPVIVLGLVFVLTSSGMARLLLIQHARISQELRESIDSRRAAVELRECLFDLIALENAQVEAVAVLHDRVRVLLSQIHLTADTPQERSLYEKIQAGFESYYDRWSRLPAIDDSHHERDRRAATAVLENEVLPRCQDLEKYNSQRIEESSATHERQLDHLVWGMALVGVLGGIAGAIFGYGMARALLRSMHQLRVQLRDVAGRLDPSLTEIVVTRTGDFGDLHSDIDQLRERIETTLATLHERESEVLRAEQLAAVGQLAAGVGHELRNPLTSVKLLVQTGIQDGRLEADDLQVIEHEIRRMERSLQSFLDFARPPKMERRPTDLASLVHDVAELLRGRSEKQQVKLELHLPAHPVNVSVDREQIRQVLVNLWLNALDAMPQGGTLRVRVEDLERLVTVSMKDSGVGFSPSILSRLFHPFLSTKDTGLGLGLVICKRIMEAHQGTIIAENDPPGGARVTLKLPKEWPHG